MTRATSDHELAHALTAVQAVTLLHGSAALKEFGIAADVAGGNGWFSLTHDDRKMCVEPEQYCALGPVILTLETPDQLAKAIRNMETLTAAGGLSSADRKLARQVDDPVKQLRVLFAVQHIVSKRLKTRGFSVLSKILRDMVNQSAADGEIKLSDLVPPSAARGADAAAKHTISKLLEPGVRT